MGGVVQHCIATGLWADGMTRPATKTPSAIGTNGKFWVISCPGSAGRKRDSHESKLASAFGIYSRGAPRIWLRRFAFLSRDLDLWTYAKAIALDFSRSGKPTSNAFIEAFNGTFRSGCLNTHWFLTLTDAAEKMGDWLSYFNKVLKRP